MKRLLVLLVLGSVAVLVGSRMTVYSWAVMIGVAVGLLASIPVTLLIIVMLRHQRRI